MVTLVSYNVLMNDTFDFPIDKKTGKLDQRFEYKWNVDSILSNDNKDVTIQLKPDLETVPSHIAVKKLKQLEEELKENEKKSILISNIRSSYSDISMVNIEEIYFAESTITLNMKFSFNDEINKLEALAQSTLEGVLNIFPFMNILDVQLKYYIESLKKDFGEETKMKNGKTVCSGIPLPIGETMTPEEITKLEKYADILNEPKRYKRVEEKLRKEIQKDAKSKPIMFLTEVSRKWADKLKMFFAKHKYDAFFVPGFNPSHDYMGQILAYPKDEYDLLNHTMVLEADAAQHFPLEGFQSPPIDWIKNHLQGKEQTSVGELAVPDIKQIFDMELIKNRRPILCTHFRKKNMLSSKKFNSFIVGSYHMPMRVGKKLWTVDPSTGEDVQKDIGRYVMGVHAYVARAKFEAFVNLMAESEIQKGLNGGNLRDRVVFMGDMNRTASHPNLGSSFAGVFLERKSLLNTD